MCILHGPAPVPAAIRDVSARGAFLETNARPPLGTAVTLVHPDAGTVGGQVSAVAADGIRIAFEAGPRAAGFALAATAADMSRPCC